MSGKHQYATIYTQRQLAATERLDSAAMLAHVQLWAARARMCNAVCLVFALDSDLAQSDSATIALLCKASLGARWKARMEFYCGSQLCFEKAIEQPSEPPAAAGGRLEKEPDSSTDLPQREESGSDVSTYM